MRDTKRLIAIAAELIVLGARYRFCCTAKRKEKLAKKIIATLAPMAAEIREEDRRDRDASVLCAEVRTLRRITSNMRRTADMQRWNLRARKIARTNRAKALPALLDQIADHLENPEPEPVEKLEPIGAAVGGIVGSTTEKPTPVEDDEPPTMEHDF